MDGSRNVNDLLGNVSSNPCELDLESPAEFYHRLFGGDYQSGYIVQARTMIIHARFSAGPVAEEDIVAELSTVRRDAAIRMLLDMHNAGTTDLSQWRFRPLAESLGFHMR